MNYHNPIIPGFYPDPSVCRAGNTYYMVCSSFQYFPGVPLFESKDLINWTQIGHVLTRESQLPLRKTRRWGGIFAPTIRYHDGRFYMVTTNTAEGGNFYVWTDDIHGEWSEPIYVEQGGIDPSLYFENGKAYFISTAGDDFGNGGLSQCEIDIETGKKLTPSRSLWTGCGGRSTEAPHLYKIGNYYYLMAAEGGTEFGHMEICARGETPYGPFEAFPHNPVLSNRDRGGCPIQACGHGDLVEDKDGNWWMFHLAVRQLDEASMYHITGREVCLVPVTFDENGYFTAGENGTTPVTVETDRIPDTVVQQSVPDYTFLNTKIGREWCYLQNPEFSNYCFENKTLSLTAGRDTLDDQGSPTFLGIRQREMKQHIAVTVTPGSQQAGLTLYMDPQHHYELTIAPSDDGFTVFRRIRLGAILHEDSSITVPSGRPIRLMIDASNLYYCFSVQIGDSIYEMGKADTKFLSSEVACTFTGVMIGLFAQNPTASEQTSARFTDFLCENRETFLS